MVGKLRLKLGGKTIVVAQGQHDVGRGDDCWLVLDDDQVSRHHARLEVGDEGAFLEDLGSRNGTFVNGERIHGRTPLRDGDRIRLGRDVITLLGTETSASDESGGVLTVVPGGESRFPALAAELVEKSVKAGRLRDAERYAIAMATQLATARVPVTHHAAIAYIKCVLLLAETTAAGVWIDRLFRLHADLAWVMSEATLEQIRGALSRIPRVPGHGIAAYEQCLRSLAKDGAAVSTELVHGVAELADTYSG